MALSDAALQSLQWHWGGAYKITFTGRGYRAARRDNGRELTADTTVDLHDLIVADYSGEPVPDQAQVSVGDDTGSE